MAEYELIQDRLISGKGILQIPTDVRKNRTYILYSDVVRLPLQQYLNKNWNPPRSRFGVLVFLRNGYVINTQSIEFQRQSYDGINDISGQTLLAVKCAYAGILQTFVNLSLALAQTPGSVGLTPIYVENTIEDYQNLRMSWNEVRLQCYADTAINLRLYALRYDVCDDDYDADIPPSEPEPLPYEPFAPGTPIEGISKPYDEVTSDDGNTVPFGEDVFPAPPTEGWCVKGNALVAPNVKQLLAIFYTTEPEVTYNASPTDIAYWGFAYQTINGGASFVTGEYTISPSNQVDCVI